MGLTVEQVTALNTVHGAIRAMALTTEQATALNELQTPRRSAERLGNATQAELQTSWLRARSHDNTAQAELNTAVGTIGPSSLNSEQATELQGSAEFRPSGSPPSRPSRCRAISSQCDPFAGLLKRGSDRDQGQRDLSGFAPASRRRYSAGGAQRSSKENFTAATAVDAKHPRDL